MPLQKLRPSRAALIASVVIALVLATSGCDELSMPPSGPTPTASSTPATDAETAKAPPKRMLGPGIPHNPEDNAEKMTAPADAGEGPVETVRAEAGVGKKGRGYGGGMVSEPVRQYFRAEQRIIFDIQIPQAVQMYKALDPNGKGPQTQEAFLKMLSENEIPLPELPPGQRYVWDAKKQELMVERPAEASTEGASPGSEAADDSSR
ncbi:MAG: hypothetical protein U0795_12290 [Pirellulales bacterium]